MKSDKPESVCRHQTATIAFERTGTRLHPRVYMVERCIDCTKELDRRSFRSYEASYSRKGEK